MPFAVMLLPSDSPKLGKTETLTFCVSHAAMEKVTGGFPFAVLYIGTALIYTPKSSFTEKFRRRDPNYNLQLHTYRPTQTCYLYLRACKYVKPE